MSFKEIYQTAFKFKKKKTNKSEDFKYQHKNQINCFFLWIKVI